jgi:putative hydrolase of the HAD superfamily
MIRAIGFDLDNTLFDHREAATRGLELLIDEKGWKYINDLSVGSEWHRLEDHFFAQYVAGTMTLMEHRRARMRGLLASTDVFVENRDLDALWDDYLRHYSNSWVAYPDVTSVLSSLKAAGYKLAVLTNGQQAQQEAKLAAMGLTELFETCLAIGTVDALKPNRQAFEHLCRVLECDAEEVLFVGDDLDYDVRASINAGLKGVWLNRSGLNAPEDITSQITSLNALRGVL